MAAELLGVKRMVPCHWGTFGAPDRDTGRLQGAALRLRGRGARPGRNGQGLMARERWFGATGMRVPEIARRGRRAGSAGGRVGGRERDRGRGARRGASARHARRRALLRRRRGAAGARPPRGRVRARPGRTGPSCSSSTCAGSRMARPSHVLHLRVRPRARRVGRRRAVQVPRGRLGRRLGRGRRGRDRDAGVREPELRAGRARAPAGGAAPQRRCWSSWSQQTRTRGTASSASWTRTAPRFTFTGSRCFEWAGGRTGFGYAAQGNILVSEATVDALAETFEAPRARSPNGCSPRWPPVRPPAATGAANNRPRCWSPARRAATPA